MPNSPFFRRLHNYALLMRLDKPIGTYLLLWPTLWGLWIATQGDPSFKLLLIFILGVFIMRAAGCVINDIADRHIDEHVERTKNRPLATGAVQTKEAVWLFIILCTLAFGLVLLLNWLAMLIAIVALGLAILYPFLKRFTFIPQVFLGLSWYLGIPMTFAAATNHVPMIAWLIYLITVIWTVSYDTIYAVIDREYDKKIGLKSTAILFGKADLLIINALQLLVLALFVSIGLVLGLHTYYYCSLIAAAGIMLYQAYLIKDRQTDKCLKAFLASHWIGLAVFIGLVAHYLSAQ